MESTSFMRVDEVAQELGVSKSYVDSYSKVTLKCHVCGNTFSKSYNAMLKHSECPHCNPSTTPKVERNPKSPKISAEEQQLNRSLKYFDKLSVNSAGKVSVLAYNGAKEKLVAHCNKCGHEWSIRADHLLARAYCPVCRKTK